MQITPIEKTGIHDALENSMKDLWERLHSSAATAREEEVRRALPRDSPEWEVFCNMERVYRTLHCQGCWYGTLLEEVYSGLTALYAYVLVEQGKAHIAGQSIQGLFEFTPLIELCMKLCSDAMIMKTVLDIEEYYIDTENKEPSCENGPDEYARNP